VLIPSRTFALTLVALGLSTAQAVTFGGLTVTPRGPQTLNLETGATELPQGGTATDNRGGIKLVASAMQLSPGTALKAQNATLTTRQGGTLRAQNMTYDLKAGTLTATGNVTYADARLKGVSANKVTLYVKTGFVAATGGVKATTPALSGTVLVFDSQTMQTLLGGPYNLKTSAGATAGKAGERLLLAFAGNRLTRSSAPDAGTLARFAPYLK
jgi:lipopolysaccharide assembly outer membrane protein LptD (OstA)